MLALRGRISRGDEAARSAYTAAYDEEIAYVDEQVQRLFDELASTGVTEDALIIVTSDHGEALFEHGRWEHGGSLFDEVIRVPLIVSGPGVRPGRISAPASLTDLMPTILDALAIEPERDLSFAGESLWPVLTGSGDLAERAIFVEGTLYGAEQKAVIQWPYKVIHQLEGNRSLLFDLDADPGELADLAAIYPERVDSLMGNLTSAIFAALQERSELSSAELDPALMQSLRALGYIR